MRERSAWCRCEVELEVVATRAHRHHHLFQRAVAGPLAQAVDGAFDLTRAADHHPGQRIGHRHAQVVVAMHAPDRLVAVGHALAQHADELAEQLGHRVADGVGDVDRRRTLGNGAFEHAAQEVGFGAVAVLGRELDVAAQVRAKRTACLACSCTCSGVMRSFFSMCSGEVAMKV